MSALAVVNLFSGHGRTDQDWPRIEQGLRALYPMLNIAFTSRRGDATDMVRRAVQEDYLEIIAVGGDGTINECLNGLFPAHAGAMQGLIDPDIVFAFLNSGSGNDLGKSFGIEEGLDAGLDFLRHSRPRRMDIGQISCLSQAGQPVTRYFLNIASFGLSGDVVQAVNQARFSKIFGGKFSYAVQSALSLLRHQDRMMLLHIDGHFDQMERISTVAIANGKYFGGGMKIAPDAQLNDGLFDVVIIGSAPKHTMLRKMRLVYGGEHLRDPLVRLIKGQKIIAAPVAETGGHTVLVECDGESVGKLPASFDILSGALHLRC